MEGEFLIVVPEKLTSPTGKKTLEFLQYQFMKPI
jgi:hypothetical protein